MCWASSTNLTNEGNPLRRLLRTMTLVHRTRGTVFTVTNNRNRGQGSLRRAIKRANRVRAQARIEFAIEPGPTTIRPRSRLPRVRFAGLIDGWTQPGFEGGPVVEINGAGARRGVGLEIVGSRVTVRGLAITGWPGHGLFVHDCTDVALQGLHVGVGLDGASPAGNGGSGIQLTEAHRCAIGGAGNETVVSSGNVGHGIMVQESADLRLRGSRLGTDRSGRVAVANGESGIKLYESPDAVLGCPTDGSVNVVSGNARYGIEIGGAKSRDLVIIGNRIGTDVAGSVAIPNTRDGIVVFMAPNVRIGGADPRERNVISGNNLYGVEIIGPEASGAILIGNFVGTDAAGLTALPNGRSNILIYNAFRSRIGGPGPGEGNVISGGARGGVNLDGSVREGHDWTGVGHAHDNLVQGNLIGVGGDGEEPLGNQLRGVLVNHAQDNTIVDNVISANGEDGVLILGPEDDSNPHLVPTGNRVARNKIGVSRSGAPCGNGRHGVFVRHGQRNMIGGEDGDTNTIASNVGRGVVFSGTGARTNTLGAINEIAANGKGAFHQPRE
jgi:hypothetical protein